MVRDVKLNRLETVLDELDYPVGREQAAAAVGDVTLVLAEGEVSLGESIAESSDDVFGSVDDLASEIRSLLPRHAVGEPYQSEGEG
jgi:hypothetical protein